MFIIDFSTSIVALGKSYTLSMQNIDGRNDFNRHVELELNKILKNTFTNQCTLFRMKLYTIKITLVQSRTIRLDVFGLCHGYFTKTDIITMHEICKTILWN